MADRGQRRSPICKRLRDRLRRGLRGGWPTRPARAYHKDVSSVDVDQTKPVAVILGQDSPPSPACLLRVNFWITGQRWTA